MSIPNIDVDDMLARKDVEIDRLRVALDKIAKMKPTAIAGVFVHGPALLLSNCQRIARDALRQEPKP